MSDRTKKVEVWHVNLFVRTSGWDLTDDQIEVLSTAGTWNHDRDKQILHLSAAHSATRPQLALEEVRMGLVRAMRRAGLRGEIYGMQVMSHALWMADRWAELVSADDTT